MTFCYHARSLAASLLLLSAPAAVADMYRCQQADGHITYQDKACSEGTQKKVDSPASGSAPSAAASSSANYKPLLAELDRRRLVREAIASGVPMVSMTRAELDSAMGSPDKFNSGQYGASVQDQLIYYRHGRTLYVYTSDGVVTSIQDMAGAPSARPRKACPSENDIRHIEIDISSIRNRDNRPLQERLQQQLADAKACQ